jgi:hypothetical protein
VTADGRPLTAEKKKITLPYYSATYNIFKRQFATAFDGGK